MSTTYANLGHKGSISERRWMKCHRGVSEALHECHTAVQVRISPHGHWRIYLTITVSWFLFSLIHYTRMDSLEEVLAPNVVVPVSSPGPGHIPPPQDTVHFQTPRSAIVETMLFLTSGTCRSWWEVLYCNVRVHSCNYVMSIMSWASVHPVQCFTHYIACARSTVQEKSTYNVQGELRSTTTSHARPKVGHKWSASLLSPSSFEQVEWVSVPDSDAQRRFTGSIPG